MQQDLKIHFALTLPRGSTVTEGLSQSSLRVVFSDRFALREALALDAAFNLWICGNREDFLSNDPLAPSVRNPVPFSHTALLTRIAESQYTAVVSVGAHTHMASPALTHILLPQAFVSQDIHTTQHSQTTVIIISARDIRLDIH